MRLSQSFSIRRSCISFWNSNETHRCHILLTCKTNNFQFITEMVRTIIIWNFSSNFVQNENVKRVLINRITQEQ